LTRQLLVFSHKHRLQVGALDLNLLAQGTEQMLRRVIGEDIHLSTRLGEGPLRVRADAAMLEHALVNLAVNARDAMPRGGALTIATGSALQDAKALAGRAELAPGRYAFLEVTDTGTGIAPEVMRHIFEPFFTTKEPGKGTGLGLATVYGLLQQLGGFVSVETAPGQGSTFRLHLPQEAAAELPAAAPANQKGASGRGEIVLLVEDDDAVRGLACLVLRRRGYVVLEARDGVEALAVSGAHPGPIHLLATDVVMPHMNGRELAERLEHRRPGLKVLFLSGHNEDAKLRAGLGERFVLLQKPFLPEAFARKVGEVLRG
jgi:two-component system, cell cycle sensor histidine kinase and response regulator CckA